MNSTKLTPTTMIQALLRKGFTQKRLAKEIGVTQSAISKHLSGSMTLRNYEAIDALRVLCTKMGVTE